MVAVKSTTNEDGPSVLEGIINTPIWMLVGGDKTPTRMGMAVFSGALFIGGIIWGYTMGYNDASNGEEPKSIIGAFVN